MMSATPSDSGVIFGNFFLLHVGHERFFQFCKSIVSHLTVVLIIDEATEGAEARRAAIEESEFVDRAEIFISNVDEYIRRNKPKYVFTGYEEREQFSEETIRRIKEHGKIIKAPHVGAYLPAHELPKPLVFKSPASYLAARHVRLERLRSAMAKFKNLKVLVIGDLIIDVFQECEGVGMSRETPTLVVTPKSATTYIGGAGVVALHAKSLGATVDFVSLTGNCELTRDAKKLLEEQGVSLTFFLNKQRKSVIKKRICLDSFPILRINEFPQAFTDNDYEEEAIKYLESKTGEYDAVLMSDFNYGTVTPYLIKEVQRIFGDRRSVVTADSQSSSQTGKIEVFRGATLVSVTEHEARVALNRYDLPPNKLAEAIATITKSEYCFLKMGKSGFLIHDMNSSDKGQITQDVIPALNTGPSDVSGAGDSLLAVASLALASGLDIWHAAYLGAIAAGVQVSRQGNVPLTPEEVGVHL